MSNQNNLLVSYIWACFNLTLIPIAFLLGFLANKPYHLEMVVLMLMMAGVPFIVIWRKIDQNLLLRQEIATRSKMLTYAPRLVGGVIMIIVIYLTEVQ